MADIIKIQRIFTIQAPGYPSYTDAIVLPQSDYDKLSQSDIDTIKTQRINNFKSIIDNPPKVVEPSIDEKIAAVTQQLNDLTSQKTDLLAQKALGGK